MSKVKALMEGVTQDLIAYLVEDKGYTIEKATEVVYTSEVYTKLMDSETGLYRESSAYVMDLLIDELTYGKIVQLEI